MGTAPRILFGRSMHRNPARPLSPHLTVWRWGPHMLASILNRMTAGALATVGAGAFVWWLLAATGGSDAAYDDFTGVARSWFGVLVGVGLSWAFLYHALAGIRHFVLDIGAGYELRTNKRWAWATIAGSLVLTALLWAYILMVR